MFIYPFSCWQTPGLFSNMILNMLGHIFLLCFYAGKYRKLYQHHFLKIFSIFFWIICHSYHMLSSLHKLCFGSKISSIGKFIYSYAQPYYSNYSNFIKFYFDIILIILILARVLLFG